METSVADANSFFEAEGSYRGVLSWLLTTDHKRIGLLYLASILSFFSVGVLLGLLMRFELISPGKTIVTAQTYNAIFTLHGVIMIFFFIIPGIPAAFGTFSLLVTYCVVGAALWLCWNGFKLLKGEGERHRYFVAFRSINIYLFLVMSVITAERFLIISL